MALATIARVTKLRRVKRRTAEFRAASTEYTRPACPDRIGSFIPWASRGRLKEPTHLEPITTELERAATEPIEVCISVPPRHGKTTTILYAIAWLLARDPTLTVLYVSYGHGFAAKQVRKIRDIAIGIGLRMGDVRRRDEWTTLEGGGVKAAGIGGQLVGEGFRLVIVDDPHKNRAEVESRQIREGVITAFREDVYTRQDPRGTSFVVIHTRWHEHDLIGELVRPSEEGDDKPFRHINIPAISVVANDGGYGEQETALAPQLWPLEKLRAFRAKIGPYAWWSLFMGSPRPRGGALFGDVHLVEAANEDPAAGYIYAIGVDLAHTAKTRSDWNAAVVLRLDPRTQRADVVDVVRRQGTLTRKVGEDGRTEVDSGFAADLARMSRAYPGARMVAYTGRDEELVLDLLAQLEHHRVYIEARPAVNDKWIRAQAYAAGWNDGRLRVLRPAGPSDGRAHWSTAFIEEHKAFTGARADRDDQVDAGAAAWDALHEGSGVEVTPPKTATPRVAVSGRKRWT